jgi:hypothetical protein
MLLAYHQPSSNFPFGAISIFYLLPGIGYVICNLVADSPARMAWKCRVDSRSETLIMRFPSAESIAIASSIWIRLMNNLKNNQLPKQHSHKRMHDDFSDLNKDF